MSEPCIVGTCGRDGSIYVSTSLTAGGKICEWHADSIWRLVESRDTAGCDQNVPGAEAREYDRADARNKRAVERRKPVATGQIYFVQVDGLIKVGWTSKLADRIRAYGPKATLLANYPGTRADEAALHRQLTPARYRGREWYSDCDITRMFIDEALAKYGPPRFNSIEWTEPKQVVAGKHFRA